MKALDKLRAVARMLREQGIEDPAKEAEILVTKTLTVDRVSLYSRDVTVTEDASHLIDSLAVRRCRGEPLQYLVGGVDFCGLSISVGPGVLIPRPETELLCEEAIRVLREEGLPRPRILDLCTGSGCIAIALARRLADSMVIAVDRSGRALCYAHKNVAINKSANVHLVMGDLYEPLRQRRFDCIVANPPYIRSTDIPNLPREIRDYEPHDALDGGPDGLSFYRLILGDAPVYLAAGGAVICEIGEGQAEQVRIIARESGFKEVAILNDYAGLDRIVVCRLTRG